MFTGGLKQYFTHKILFYAVIMGGVKEFPCCLSLMDSDVNNHTKGNSSI